MSHRENENIHEPDCCLSQTNLLAAAQCVSQQVVDRTIARGYRLRAEAHLHLLTALGRGIRQLVKRTRQAYLCRRDAGQAEKVLRALDGHVRRDIGIDGHQIPALARCPDEEADAERVGRTPMRKSPAAESSRGVSDDSCVGCAA